MNAPAKLHKYEVSRLWLAKVVKNRQKYASAISSMDQFVAKL